MAPQRGATACSLPLGSMGNRGYVLNISTAFAG
jgi:hypothetical protein